MCTDHAQNLAETLQIAPKIEMACTHSPPTPAFAYSQPLRTDLVHHDGAMFPACQAAWHTDPGKFPPVSAFNVLEDGNVVFLCAQCVAPCFEKDERSVQCNTCRGFSSVSSTQRGVACTFCVPQRNEELKCHTHGSVRADFIDLTEEGKEQFVCHKCALPIFKQEEAEGKGADDGITCSTCSNSDTVFFNPLAGMLVCVSCDPAHDESEWWRNYGLHATSAEEVSEPFDFKSEFSQPVVYSTSFSEEPEACSICHER
jgi:hypothetical protein